MNQRKYYKRKRRKILLKRVFVAVLIVGMIVSAVPFAINYILKAGYDKETRDKINSFSYNTLSRFRSSQSRSCYHLLNLNSIL